MNLASESVQHFEHRMAMRWSDLDLLNHVNNVLYLEYGAEAEEQLPSEAAKLLPRNQLDNPSVGGAHHITVEFRRPLQRSTDPLIVTTELGLGDVRHSMRLGNDDAPYAVVSAKLSDSPVVTLRPGLSHQLQLRARDRQLDGSITDTTFGELWQEARILFFDEVTAGIERSSVALAQLDLFRYERSIWRVTELTTRHWVERVGRSSFTVIGTTLVDNRVVASSRAILVAFDPRAQKSAALSDAERSRYTALIPPEA